MKINLVVFITSIKEQTENNIGEVMIKTFESTLRPVKGDMNRLHLVRQIN